MHHKLQCINIGDTVEYKHEGAVLTGRVHGWKLCDHGYDHRAVVGISAYQEHEVSLRSVLSRHRATGIDQGTVTF